MSTTECREDARLNRAWRLPENKENSLENSHDLIRLQVDVCLREAEKSEKRENHEAAEAFYIHALSIDESNAGE